MKLESRLLRSSGFLHVVPILDVVLLLLIFFLLLSSLTLPSGIAVELPKSAAILRPMVGAHVLTVSAGASPTLYLNDKRVSLADLRERLGEVREVTGDLLVRADRLAPYGLVVEISNLALSEGYAVGLATTEPESEP